MLRKLFGLAPVLAVTSVFIAANPFIASAQLANRSVEPVVLTGADVPTWSGPPAAVACQPSALINDRDAHNDIVTVPAAPPTAADPNEIAAYKWDGAQFVEIPVQVDEMYPFCLSNPNSNPGVGFGQYSGTDKELTYAWDHRGLFPARVGTETWRKTDGTCSALYHDGISNVPDPVPTLDNDDEIVLMASDAGDIAPPLTPMPPGVTSMHAVLLHDPLDPAYRQAVYLALQTGGSSYDVATGYVTYARDPDADAWIDRGSFLDSDPEKLGTSNTTYGPNLPGQVCRTNTPFPPDTAPRASTDRFLRDRVVISTPTYQVTASGRWMFRELKIAKPGQPGVYGPDLIDRWKGRAFQQSPDSSISLVGFEDEQVNWEANGALLGELAGPVRAIREIWGADSGTNVTKTEAYYRDVVTHRYHVRVHPIPPDGLYTSWDYNHDVVTNYYNVLKPAGVAVDGCNDDTGNVDGVFGQAAFFDAPDPTFNVPSAVLNWEQMSGRDDSGSLVYIIEMKGATTAGNSAVVPYYRDDACLDDGTGDNPLPRAYPGDDSQSSQVQNGYCAENGEPNGCDLSCPVQSAATCAADVQDVKTQGCWGCHGVHYFVTSDSDNAQSPEALNEIDAQQWQFVVPTAAPANVGQEYGNVVIAPLQVTAIDVSAGGVVNPSPVASNGTAMTPVNTAVDVDLSGIDLNDCELTFAIDTPPANGVLGAISSPACTAGVPNGDSAVVTYTPNAGFTGPDTFTYTVSDLIQTSPPAVIAIAVGGAPPPPNAPPSAAGSLAATTQGVATNLSLSGIDLETCNLTFSIVQPPAGGVLAPIVDAGCTPGLPNVDTATVLYTPNAPFSGTDTFTYKVNDGTQDSPTATAVIVVAPTVGAIDTAPTAGDTSATAEFETAVDVALGGADLESCDLTFSIVDPPAHGSLGAIVDETCSASLPNGDSASVTYTPDAGYSGQDSFTYRVNDGTQDSVPATATITVKEPVVAPPCEAEPEPAIDCVQAGRAMLRLRDERVGTDGAPTDNPDVLRFKWLRATAVTADFGDPLTSTTFNLCVYDEARGPIAGAIYGPGGACDNKPCWKQTRDGYKYKSRKRAPTSGRSAVYSSLVLKGGGAGRGKITAKRMAAMFPVQVLPAVQPVVVQLKNSNGKCWQASFDAPAKRNDTKELNDRQ